MSKFNEERSSYWNMENLNRAISHDSKHKKLSNKKNQSIYIPFLNDIDLYIDKDVLEIGAGVGRQYIHVKDRVKKYSIADIFKPNLNNSMFKEVKNKYLIKDYKTDDFKIKFDIIHFWFVIHHVFNSELKDFVDFLDRHLKKDGKLLFNYPGHGTVMNYADGDGDGNYFF